MALSLLPFAVFLLVATVCSGGDYLTSTFAIIQTNPPAVCGIVSGQPTQYIKCFQRGQTTSIQPNISFQSISGGLNIFCGLDSTGLSIFCWNLADPKYYPSTHRKRIYHSSTVALTDLTVGGSDQICAREIDSGIVRCWHDLGFPDPDPALSFKAITLGDEFGCGILTNTSTVHCWGNTTLEGQFGDLKMESLVAGQFHESACGMTETGDLVCRGDNEWGQLDPPANSGFELDGVAVGQEFTCAIRRQNGKLTCWGSGVDWAGINVTGGIGDSSVYMYAASDFICGIKETDYNYTVSCWGDGWTRFDGYSNEVPLGTLIPGPCVEFEVACHCNLVLYSTVLCDWSGVICDNCPRPILLPPPIPPAAGNKSKVRN
ncbi:Putative serine/threonine-protein kinase-like protein CCR3 [Linum perenne]